MKTPTPASDSSINTDAYRRQFRNQATGMGATVVASQATGAMRSQRVIDAAPSCQLAAAQGYPAAHPEADVTGTLRDRLTGKVWKQPNTGPHL